MLEPLHAGGETVEEEADVGLGEEGRREEGKFRFTG